MKFNLQPVDGQLRNIFPDLIGRCNKAHLTGRLSHADADGECSFLPFFQHRTILILRTPGHCDAGIDVFADGVFQKSFWCKDDRFARGKLFVDGKAGVCYIIPVDRTLCAAKVPEARMAAFVERVNAEPGVTHNYQREHAYTIWFTLISPSRQDAQATLDAISRDTGVDILNLPATKLFKIRVDFRMDTSADEA